MKSKLRRFVSDSDGNVVLAQAPNIPIIGWLVCLIAAAVAPSALSPVLSFLSAAFLFTWAYLELTQGSSPARRVLGAAVMIYLVVSHLEI